MHCQVHLSVHAYTNDYLRCTKCEVHDRVRKYVIKCKKKCVPRFLTLEALIYHIKIKNQRAIINYKVRTATKKNKQKKNTHTHTNGNLQSFQLLEEGKTISRYTIQKQKVSSLKMGSQHLRVIHHS